MIEKPLGEVWIRLTRQTHEAQFSLEAREFERFSDFEQSLRQLAEVTREIPIYLSVGPAVPLEDFVSVYDACRNSGFNSINFAIAPRESFDALR